MCDFSKGFKLCSCSNEKIKFREQQLYYKVKGELVKVKNKKNDQIPLIYIWQLYRRIGEYEDFMLGSYKMPSEDIGKGLNAEWIALNLNVENCFDFEYSPEEDDNLIIGQNEILSPYISFIFKKGEWIIEHHDPFTIKTKDLKIGKILEIE